VKKGRRYQDVIANNLKSIYIDQHFYGREREKHKSCEQTHKTKDEQRERR